LAKQLTLIETDDVAHRLKLNVSAMRTTNAAGEEMAVRLAHEYGGSRTGWRVGVGGQMTKD
jgi:hypothetical protein